MVQIKCSNITLCKQFVNKRINKLYCKDCLFYFNYKLEFLYNNILYEDRIKPSCPICLLDDKILYIKQKICNHFTCIECFYDIYFNKNFLRNMPINPVFELKNSWNLFIYSSKAIRIKKKFLNNFMFTLHDFNYELFDEMVEKYKHIIPNLFKRNFEELIKFQLKKNKYIFDYKKTQSEKIQLIEKCPFCRKCKN
jgi:hypothetical protein